MSTVLEERPKVRIDGEVEVPEKKWYHISDILTRLDELVELLVKLVNYQNELIGKVITKLESIDYKLSFIMPTPAPAVIDVNVLPLNNKYKVYRVDLSEAHVNFPVGLMRDGITANTLTILRADSTAYIRLNDTENDEVEAVKDLVIRDLKITEIYVTNDAAPSPSYLDILVLYRE